MRQVGGDRRRLWLGRALGWSAALFLLVASAAPKLAGASIASETLTGLGWPAGQVRTIGAIELACVLLYLVPRTRVLGAVLTTGLLGGAVAAHLRVGSPLFSHTLFGIYLGLFLWGGLWLCDGPLRVVLPLSRTAKESRP